MHRREKVIRRMVADLGLEVSGFRQDGGSHWRVDVKAPNGRQRPFTFPTRNNGNWHSEKNELAMLRRWRREVMPELDAAEEAGELEVPQSMKTTLAQRLEELGIPLRKEPDPQIASQVLRPLTRLRDKPVQTPPFQRRIQFESGTPEAALAESIGAQAPAPAPTPPPPPPPPQEKSVSTPTEHIRANGPHQAAPQQAPPRSRQETGAMGGRAKKGIRNNVLGRAGEIRLADWLRAPNRLDGPTNSLLLAEQASKELGLNVTHSNVLGLMKDLGLEVKQMTRTYVNGSQRVTRNEYVAQVLVAVVERLGGAVPTELLAIAAGDRAVRFVNAPMPTWPEQQ